MENSNDELYYSTTKKIISLIKQKKIGKWKAWEPGEFTPRPDLDSMINKYCENEGIKISGKDENDEGIPYYNGYNESIFIPEVETDTDTYYSVIFHELSHSTGMFNRLKRATFFAPLSIVLPGAEEIVAELSACFICSIFGINSFENNLAYIKDWCDNESADADFVRQLMPDAIKAANYILEHAK
jgi:antirestriction protein ArdC